ncbi:hypothetical protein C8R46DRAFT_902402, partial [Mycena filopes]
MASIGRFPLDRAPPSSPNSGTGDLTCSQFTFRAFVDPTPTAPPKGSFESDQASSEYTRSWVSWTEFQGWRAAEEEKHCIELRLVNTFCGLPEFERQCRYVCSRAGTGGQKEYTKRHPEWTRKIPSKHTDCRCILMVKEYPGTSTVLGTYRAEHNHPLGHANLRFTRISKETREYIAGLLCLKVDAAHIVNRVPNYSGKPEFDLGPEISGWAEVSVHGCNNDTSTSAKRNEFIQLRDIRRIEKDIEAETSRLHPDDGESDHLLGFKSKTDPVPLGSGLTSDVFVLMVQTDWQRKMFQKYGEALLCMEATHNVT